MNLFNKKLLAQQIARYDFPSGDKFQEIQKVINGWQKALKDSNLGKTKEKSVQGKFLNKFFEQILGYEDNTGGLEKWTLIVEPTTEVDAQAADGSLGIFSKDNKQTLAVIELKDAKTSLDKKQSGRVGKMTPVEQAFNYLNKFDRCKWAIVSNFREIRIYSKIRGQGFYEKFEITDLHQDQEFKKFFYILNKDNLIDEGSESVIEILAKNTTAQEEDITKKFYKEYKEIRLNLINHLFEHNSEINKFVLIEKTQKLLDRLIFTMVCEDSSTLLPTELVKNTYDGTFKSFALSNNDQRVWIEFKGLFHAIDRGNKRVNPPINAYNGGLFKTDEVLDNLIIKDDVWEEIISLAGYDFQSDLNVNVLGHIFEQSISDLEEIRESVGILIEDGNALLTEDGQKITLEQSHKKLAIKTGKRKKMGIFYTPEYITKFIVENTVGKFLEENPKKLEDIKILDPACGSGAFLNQAHSFLLNEYKVKTEESQLEKTERGEALSLLDQNFTDNDKTILLNNLFGVDLSPESVEITKLALWLKTARATEPLQNLDNNIKCGNSLINDPEIAGKRAFNWTREFKEIIDQGGFDVIVGNPPYGVNFSKEEKKYLKNFNPLVPDYEIYIYFISKGLSLLKNGGILSYIFPNTFLSTIYGKKFRASLAEKFQIISVVDLSDDVTFKDASVRTSIVTIKKEKADNKTKFIKYKKETQDFSTIINSVPNKKLLENIDNWAKFSYVSEEEEKLVQKIKLGKHQLKDFFEVSQGLIPYDKYRGHDEFTIKNRIWHAEEKKDETYKKELRGKDVRKNFVEWNGKKWISYGSWLAAPREKKFFNSPRVLVREITNNNGLLCAYTENELYNNPSVINIVESSNDKVLLKNLLAVLNSKIISWYYGLTSPKAKKGLFPKILINDVRKIPLPSREELLNLEITKIVDQIISLNRKLQSEKKRLLEILVTRFKLKQTTNLSDFHQLGWNELVGEIEKQKIEMDLDEEDKLSKWFNKVRKQLLKIETEIQNLEQTIDKTLYKIYGLNAEEIELVENI